jgi:predicted phosphodiesterase
VRYLILSDMHGNWDAFEAVLRHCRRKRFDGILVLGDLVGYGASPNKVVDAVRGFSTTVYAVRGNHDKVVAGMEDGSSFNQVALDAVRWTIERLDPDNLRYVAELAQGPTEVAEDLVICHGSPLDEDAYLLSNLDALQVFQNHPYPVTFFGHTHIPSLFSEGRGGLEVRRLTGRDGTIHLEPEVRYLINPGSIGQPRDRDARAGYMTYDGKRRLVRWYRVDYPIDEAQKKITEAGLPTVLAERLAYGV